MTISPDVDWPVWSIDVDPTVLGRYVVPEAVRMHARIPAASGEAVSTRLRMVWQVLRDKKVGYAFESPAAEARVQRVRPPGEVLVAPGSGTCLDLALVLAAACEHAGLRAGVVLLDAPGGGAGHALVVVGLGEWWPLTDLVREMPDGFTERVAMSLSGPSRDLVVVDPNGLAVSLGATATTGLDTDLDSAVATGHSMVTDPRWSWRLAVHASPSTVRYRPAEVPKLMPLREIYQRPDAAGSVLALVRAEYGLTPFQARDETIVLDDFAHQIAAGDKTGLVVIHGAGGAGKSRLGLELTERFRQAGWYAGPLREFVTEGDTSQRSASLTWLAAVTAPLMVMVDYADAHADDLSKLLAAVKDRAGPPAVVVATARTIEAEWLNDVTDALRADGHRHRVELVDLPDLHPHPGPVYQRTAEKLGADIGDLPLLPSTRPGHSWTTLDLVLLGWLAATTVAALPATKIGLYGQVLDHEQKYWAATYRDLAGGRADRRLLAEAAACLTLLGPPDLDSAAETLKVVTVLAEDGRWRRDIARTFEVCLRQRAGERWAIRPDPIGDYHLTQLLTDDRTLLTKWLPASTGDQALVAALLVLQRASDDGASFELILRAQPGRWPIVLAIATALGGPAQQALEALAEVPDTPLPLDEISEQIPFQPTGLWRLARRIDERRLHTSTVLTAGDRAALLQRISMRRRDSGDRHGALKAISEAVELYRQLAQTNPAGFLPHLAESLNDLALQETATGDQAGALAAITEAVDLYRQLTQGDSPEFLPDLAKSLNDLSNGRSNTGDQAGALEAINEAVDLFRQLAKANSSKFLPDLASSLITLSNGRSNTGDRPGALEAITEAVDLFRQLAQVHPAAFLPDLAMSLNNMAAARSAAGDRTGALEAITDAVDLYRQLAQDNPAVFLPDLAMSLNNLSNGRSDTGDRAGALQAITEAVDLYRQLAQDNPAAFLPNFSSSLITLSNGRSNTGDRAGALEAVTEAVGIRRKLAQTNPAVFLPDLAMSLNTLSIWRSAVGDRAGALEAISEAVDLYRQLAQANPAVFLPDLAGSLLTASNRRSENGNRMGALEAITEAVGLYRQLARANPGAFLPDVANSLNNLAAARSETGDRTGALEAVTEAVGIRRQLSQANPRAFLPDVANSLNNLAAARSRAGDQTGALEAVTEAVGIRRQLAQANPDAFLPDLAVSLNNLSVLRSKAGDNAGALEVITEAVVIRRHLAQDNPAAFLPDLAVSLNNLSNARSGSGDRAGALEAITEAVDLYRQLAQANPAAFLADLAMSLNNLSNWRSAVNDQAGALEATTEAVELYRQLAQGNLAAFLPDLATSLITLSNRRFETGDRAGALDEVTEAVDLYRQLAQANPAAFLPDLTSALNNLSVYRSKTGDRAGALDTITEAVDLYRQLAQANPAAFLPRLARSLNNLSDLLLQNNLDTNRPWTEAITPLPRLYQGWLRSHHAAWLNDNDHIDLATAELVQAAIDTSQPNPQDPHFVIAQARQHVRATALRLNPTPAGLPVWATTPLPDDHITFINAWLNASTWPERETALNAHRALAEQATIQDTLNTLTFLNVSNSSLDQLSAVIAAIQERGFDDVLTALHTQWDQESVLNDWISTPTWTESLAYLQQHAGTLTQPAIRDFLNASDEPVLRQHAAILTLGDHYPPATILRILTEPTETADLALHALETANLTTLAALLTACPATTRIRGVGPLLRAILLTAAGQEERAAAVLGDALAEFTTLQKRAYRIRLNKLLATENANLTPEFRNEVIAFIDLLNQNEPPPGEAVTD